MKLSNERKRIYIDVFDHTIYIIFTKDVYKYRNVQLVKECPRMGRYECNFLAVHTYDTVTGTSWCILPNKAPVHLVVHEVNHAIDTMVDFYGLEGTEIKSYLLGYVMKKIYG